MKKKISIILIVILILMGLISGFIYWLKYQKPEKGLCAKFPKIKGEISCQEAIDLALEKYPGEIYEIDKTKLSFFFGEIIKNGKEIKDLKEVKKDVWLIGIRLKEPFEIIEQDLKKFGQDIKVSVDVKNGDLRIDEINWKPYE